MICCRTSVCLRKKFCSKWGISEKELETDEAGTNYTELTAEIEGQECIGAGSLCFRTGRFQIISPMDTEEERQTQKNSFLQIYAFMNEKFESYSQNFRGSQRRGKKT